MEASLGQLLAELAEAGRCHDAQEQDHSRKMLNLEPATAHLISMLVRSSRRTQLLEIGTSNGYSTIWLAWATRPPIGRVTSIERKAHKLALADANLRQAGLREVVDLIHGGVTIFFRENPTLRPLKGLTMSASSYLKRKKCIVKAFFSTAFSSLRIDRTASEATSPLNVCLVANHMVTPVQDSLRER